MCIGLFGVVCTCFISKLGENVVVDSSYAAFDVLTGLDARVSHNNAPHSGRLLFR
jgi:hypothetical protein